MNRLLVFLSLCLAIAVSACGSSDGMVRGGDGGMNDGGDLGSDGGDGGPGDPNTKVQPAGCRNSFNQAVSDFAVDVTVVPNGTIQAGQEFTADITPTLNLSSAFLQGAADTLGDLQVALEEVTVISTQVEVGVVGGTTTGDPVLSQLGSTPQVVTIPHEGPDGTVPTVITGPVVLELPTVTGTFTAGAAGETAYFCIQGDVPDMVIIVDEPSQTYVEVMVSIFNVDFACELGSADLQDPESDTDDVVTPGDPETDCIGFVVEP